MNKTFIEEKLNELLESFNSYERKANRMLTNLDKVEKGLLEKIKKDESLKNLYGPVLLCVQDINHQLHNINVDKAIINQIKENLKKDV